MYCENCGEERNHRRYCQNCGHKFKKGRHLKTILLVALLLMIGAGGTIFANQHGLLTPDKVTVAEDLATKETPKTKEKQLEPERTETKKVELKEDQETDLTDIIAAAQESVYTIFTYGKQGSGFLYNNSGAVVTNAHVVEGEIDVSVKTVQGEELPGTVIGYSNETDVAVIDVPDLAGKNAYAIEKSNDLMIGEEVIALGSPLGFENTATMGFVTGKNRSFTIDNYTYNNIYQMSAPIASGSSGGPLISKTSEKIVAINSAASTLDDSIGFSIPLYNIVDLIDKWIAQPMSEEDILAQFYNAEGGFFFEDLWEYGDGYFDGGEYSDDDDYYDYWEYDYDSEWDEYDDYDDNWYWDDEYDDDYDDDWYWDEDEEYDVWYDDWYDEEYDDWDEEDEVDYEEEEFDEEEDGEYSDPEDSDEKNEDETGEDEGDEDSDE